MNYSKTPVAELRQMAAEKGIVDAASMKKKELVELLEELFEELLEELLEGLLEELFEELFEELSEDELDPGESVPGESVPGESAVHFAYSVRSAVTGVVKLYAFRHCASVYQPQNV